MSEVIERVEATAVEQARPQPRQSLLQKFASRYSVDPNKLLETLKQVAFRQRPDSRTGEVVQVTNEQMIALLIVADQYGLNPFTKEIYAFPDKNNGIVPVLGVDGWIRIIQKQPEYDGEEFFFSDEKNKAGIPEWVEVRMYRKDRTRPTIVREYFEEVVRDVQPWRTHPRRMLRHKGLIQCARVAFGFGGIYDEDEAARIVDGDVRVVSTDNDPTMQSIESRAARRAAAAPALEQAKPVMIEQTIDAGQPMSQELAREAATNAPVTDGGRKPDTSAAPDGASSRNEGDAPAVDASPSQAEPAKGRTGMTFAQLEERLRKCETVDELNDVAPLIQSFGKRDATDLTKVYRERLAQISGGA